MLRSYRKSVVLILALLVSHAALTLHVSTHVPADQASCEYCSGEAKPSHAMTPAVAATAPPAAQPLPSDATASSPGAPVATGYRQRAPPTPA